LKLTTS